jgi:hypothetical protein
MRSSAQDEGFIETHSKSSDSILEREVKTRKKMPNNKWTLRIDLSERFLLETSINTSERKFNTKGHFPNSQYFKIQVFKYSQRLHAPIRHLTSSLKFLKCSFDIERTHHVFIAATSISRSC